MSNKEIAKPPQVGGSGLNDGLDMVNAQTGISAGADFESNTWTFDMPNGFNAGAGKYMIVKVVSNAK